MSKIVVIKNADANSAAGFKDEHTVQEQDMYVEWSVDHGTLTVYRSCAEWRWPLASYAPGAWHKVYKEE